MPSEIRDLHLPVTGMHNRPRRQEEDGGFSGAVHLVIEVGAVAPDMSSLVRIARPRLLTHFCQCRCDRSSRKPSIQSSSSACPVVMPERRSTMIPKLKVTTSETSAS